MQRKIIPGSLAPAGSVLVAVLISGTLAGGGAAAATARTGTGAASDGGPTGPGVIRTVAGGVGGPANARHLAVQYPWADMGGELGPVPCWVTFARGSLYVGDQVSVLKVNPQTDRLTPVAGTADPGPVYNGEPATSAATYGACAVAMDQAGNLVISDYAAARVEVVAESTGTFYGRTMQRGRIYTIAGNGQVGFSGDGGPATDAKLNGPVNLTLDPAGNVVIDDRENERIRVVAEHTGTFYGRPMTAGDIYTIAGNGTAGASGDNGPAIKAELDNANGMAFDPNGNLAIAGGHNNRVRLVAEHTGTFYGRSMKAGDIYTIAGDGDGVYTADGIKAIHSGVANPQAVAFDAAGNMLIADWGNERIRVVAASNGTFYGGNMTAGDIYTIAGRGHRGSNGIGGPATRAKLNDPNSVTLDGAGNVVIGFVSSVDSTVKVVAEQTGRFYGQQMTAGDIYNVTGNQRTLGCCEGLAATHAQLPLLAGITADKAGDMATAVANRVWLVPAGTGTVYGRSMTAGHLYLVAGTGRSGDSGNGGPATHAELRSPRALTVDAAGNLVIADTGSNEVRVVAASNGTFYGQPMTEGDIYTLAGDGTSGYSGDAGPATSAELNNPAGASVDTHGNLIIADTGNNRIRVVAASNGTFYGQPMTTGDIYTAAGNGHAGFSGDGQAGTVAELNGPVACWVESDGNVLVADHYNSRIRMITG
jgi:trimeric autotransporter adhesin